MAKYQWVAGDETVGAPPAGLENGLEGSLSDWIVVENAAATGGKTVRLNGSPATARRRLVLPGVNTGAGRIDVRGRFYRSGGGTTASFHFVVVRLKGSVASDGYDYRMDFDPATARPRVSMYNGSAFTEIAESPVGYSVTNAWANFRYTFNPDASPNHTLSVWTDAEGEGGGVSFTTDGLSAAIDGTKVGFGALNATTNEYDWITVGTGGDDADLTPSAGTPTPVSFSGTIPTQNATEGTPFSVDLSTYFSGTETPFTYAVQAGTLPTGLTLNSSTGVISGTPTTAGTATGIVIRATDGNLDTADSNSFSIDVAAADTTAPVLTSPTGTATGQTTASGTVSTDEANGTLYYLATTNSSESAATVKGGSSQAVTTTGEQSVSVTGLTAGTGYYLHYAHRDAAGNDSAVASSVLFTTDAAPVVVKGVRIQLHDGATEQASLSGLTVAWFDDDDPATMGAPVLQSATETTDASGWLEVDLDGYTALGVGDPGFLIVYKAGATAADDIVFAGRLVIEDIG